MDVRLWKLDVIALTKRVLYKKHVSTVIRIAFRDKSGFFTIFDISKEATPSMSLPYVDPICPPTCMNNELVSTLSSSKPGPN